MAWEQWFQDVGASVINKAADAKFTQPYEIDRLRLEALGELGPYTEGQAQTRQDAGINPTWLLIGAAVVAVLMLRD